MKLWEIHDEIERVILRHSDMETGELDPAFEQELDKLDMARRDKICAVGRYIMGERTEGNAVKSQADRLAARAKVHFNRADRMKAYLSGFVTLEEKHRDEVVQIGWRKNPPSVDVSAGCDLATWPIDFIKVSYEPRRKALLEAINRGDTVPKGVRKVQHSTLHIR